MHSGTLTLAASGTPELVQVVELDGIGQGSPLFEGLGLPPEGASTQLLLPFAMDCP